MSIASYRIAVPDAAVADLRDRLARTRWPSPIANDGWSDGPDAGYLRDLVAYWRTGHDWRAREARLNAYRHHTAVVDGVTLHFIWADGAGADRIPLLLLHG